MKINLKVESIGEVYNAKIFDDGHNGYSIKARVSMPYEVSLRGVLLTSQDACDQ